MSRKSSTLAMIMAILIAGGAMLLSGCGENTPNPEGTATTFNPDPGPGQSGHIAGWLDAASHGAAAKAASGGFESCKQCHGGNYSGGISNTSCFTCHNAPGAPHPAAPWRGAALTHVTTDQGNASACVGCHQYGALSSVTPTPIAPAGTAPGCFNNTLCHGPIEHPAGWSQPAQHGAQAAQGFSSCKVCHGADYKGGTAAISCYQCHAGPGLDHPAANWVIANHKTAALTGNTTCKTCHGADFSGGGSGIACASCHMQNETKVHMTSWYPDVRLNHRAYARANGTASCSNASCHGADLAGVAQSGPSCSSCHTWPLTQASGHAANWGLPTEHGVSAEQDFSVCQACHGADYKGGSVMLSCYQCHNGPGLNHPAANWVVANHKTAALAGNTSCKTCHGADFSGGGSGVACASCHMQNETKVHMTSWYPDVRLNHRAYAKTNGTASCSNVSCHGANLAGVAQSGPSCSSCHSWPFTPGGGGGACGTCHGIPPAGTAAPDRDAAHAAHTALGAYITCNTCHSGAGAGTIRHEDGTVNVSIDAVYNAKSGAAAFNSTAKTCSNVSCHGGPRTSATTMTSTPSWLTGAININTQCTSCHVRGSATGNPEANSYFSGEHAFHSSRASCTQCHDTAKLATGHFEGLNTAAFETPASATLLNSLNYNSSTRSCSPSCHGRQTW